MDTIDTILEYEGLVYSAIRRYTRYFEQDDLYQVGMMGLINAYQNYDKSQNTKFSTYAYYYILGEVRRFVRESSLVKVGTKLVRVSQEVEKAREVMSQKLGREPTVSELSVFLEMDVETIEEARVATQEVQSLDYKIDADSQELYNFLSCEDNGLNDKILDLRAGISNLDEESREIIRARYYDDMTQTEASKKLGISQVQVSRKEGKILEKLRESLQ